MATRSSLSGKAVERTLQVDPKGIELILALMSKSMPQGSVGKDRKSFTMRVSPMS